MLKDFPFSPCVVFVCASVLCVLSFLLTEESEPEQDNKGIIFLSALLFKCMVLLNHLFLLALCTILTALCSNEITNHVGGILSQHLTGRYQMALLYYVVPYTY